MIYWIADFHVFKASMDGANETLISSPGTFNPQYLALDISTQTLYLSDPQNRIVESMNADGTNRTLLSFSEQVYGILVYNNNVYVHDLYVIKALVNKSSRSSSLFIRQPTVCRIRGFQVLDEMRQPMGKFLIRSL